MLIFVLILRYKNPHYALHNSGFCTLSKNKIFNLNSTTYSFIVISVQNEWNPDGINILKREH